MFALIQPSVESPPQSPKKRGRPTKAKDMWVQSDVESGSSNKFNLRSPPTIKSSKRKAAQKDSDSEEDEEYEVCY